MSQFKLTNNTLDSIQPSKKSVHRLKMLNREKMYIFSYIIPSVSILQEWSRRVSVKWISFSSTSSGIDLRARVTSNIFSSISVLPSIGQSLFFLTNIFEIGLLVLPIWLSGSLFYEPQQSHQLRAPINVSKIRTSMSLLAPFLEFDEE